MGNIAIERETAAAGAPHAHPKWLPWLAGWRGISIAGVLVGHFTGDHFFALGALGVEMFFVLSARLMAEILFVEQTPLVEFYRRRFSRVYPTLIVFLLVTCTVLTIGKFAPGLTAHPIFGLSAVCLLINYLSVAGYPIGFSLAHLWSLSVEEHSYILLALLAVFVRRKSVDPRRYLLVGAGLSMLDGVISNLVFGQTYTTGYWRTDAHIASMLLSAWFFLTLRRRSTPLPGWVGPVSATVGAVAMNVHFAFCVWFTVGTTFLALGVNAMDTSWPFIKRLLSWRPLTFLGLISYSTYLWQQPIVGLTDKVFKLSHRQAEVTALPATLIVGWISYQFLEKPTRKWLNELDLTPLMRRKRRPSY